MPQICCGLSATILGVWTNLMAFVIITSVKIEQGFFPPGIILDPQTMAEGPEKIIAESGLAIEILEPGAERKFIQEAELALNYRCFLKVFADGKGGLLSVQTVGHSITDDVRGFLIAIPDPANPSGILIFTGTPSEDPSKTYLFGFIRWSD